MDDVWSVTQSTLLPIVLFVPRKIELRIPDRTLCVFTLLTTFPLDSIFENKTKPRRDSFIIHLSLDIILYPVFRLFLEGSVSLHIRFPDFFLHSLTRFSRLCDFHSYKRSTPTSSFTFCLLSPGHLVRFPKLYVQLFLRWDQKKRNPFVGREKLVRNIPY